MRKSWFIWIAALAFVLVLSACSDSDTDTPGDVKEKENQIESKKQKEKTESEEETDETDEVEEPETSMDKQESKKDNSASETQDQSDDNKADQEDDFSYDSLIDLGFEIFDAQVDEDYDYLESAISKGSSIDKANNTFQFDNVTHPHEYKFITEEDRRFLSERYVNGDDEKGVIVGYEVTDYETESSYVIDTEFIKEDGKWKLNDIDVNK